MENKRVPGKVEYSSKFTFLMQRIWHWYRALAWYLTALMASSLSGQEEQNPALWLAARAGKLELSCPLNITRFDPQEKLVFFILSNRSHVRVSGWILTSFYFAWFWTRPINTKRKNFVNIQPSWARACSITEFYRGSYSLNAEFRPLTTQNNWF